MREEDPILIALFLFRRSLRRAWNYGYPDMARPIKLGLYWIGYDGWEFRALIPENDDGREPLLKLTISRSTTPARLLKLTRECREALDRN